MSEYIVTHGIRIAKDFIPETFGRLTTIGPRFMLPTGSNGLCASRQVCLCECGVISLVFVNGLVKGTTASCGCLRKAQAARKSTKHGMYGTPEYRAWRGLQNRCRNTHDKDYQDYGGRGITVCARWLDPENGFANFLADMGLRPEGAYSIEREEVNGNYCPENCRWATDIEQNRNRRNNRLLTYKGKTQCLIAWAEELSEIVSTLQSRVARGWPDEKVLSTPTGTRRAKKLNNS